jgi:hypothetical protein
MQRVNHYRDINKANWDERAPAHAASPGYNVQGFIDDPELISHVVRFDLLRLVEGLQITGLVEHDSVPWEAQPGQMSKDDQGEWRLTDRLWRLPASYTLQAVKG